MKAQPLRGTIHRPAGRGAAVTPRPTAMPVVWSVGLTLGLLWALLTPAMADEAAFEADVRALTATPHRLSGTPEAHAAAQYIRQRLAQIGLTEVFTLDMPVWQTVVDRCEIQIDGQSFDLLPLRPNLIASPVTPEEGITGELLYIGRGNPEDYGDRDPAGRIVVLEYDSLDQWERAFMLGAKAVLFLGNDQATPVYPKHVGIPANLIRLYVPQETQRQVDLRQLGSTEQPVQVTIRSHVRWEKHTGTNIVAVVPGEDPGFVQGRTQPEMLVLSASYDSFGVVPQAAVGARRAGNVAALLQAAEHLHAQRPKRDVTLMFLDNRARHHQGAREVYYSLAINDKADQDLRTEHAEEQRYYSDLRHMLDIEGFDFQGETRLVSALSSFLRYQADFIHADLVQDRVTVRIQLRQLRRDPELAEQLQEQVEQYTQTILRWDNIRRVMHYENSRDLFEVMTELAQSPVTLDDETTDDFRRRVRRLGIRYGFDALAEHDVSAAQQEARSYLQLLEQLRQQALDRFDDRLGELAKLIEQDEQRLRLRQRLADRWVVLHVDYNLADHGPTWGILAGDRYQNLYTFATTSASADNPGYYGRVLGAFREVAAQLPEDQRPDEVTLRDPMIGARFAPGHLISTGSVAGTFGYYNVSLVTGYDARPRDGHPADTFDNLDWRVMHRQSAAAAAMLWRLADAQSISLPRQFNEMTRHRVISWSSRNDRSSGPYAAMRITGALSEDRPAINAMMAIWPARGATAASPFRSQENANLIADFDPILLEAVDTNGRFRFVGLHREVFGQAAMLGSRFDEFGRIEAIGNQTTLLRNTNEASRVEIVPGKGYVAATLAGLHASTDSFAALRAASDARLQDVRRLDGRLGAFVFFYLSAQDRAIGISRMKLFQPEGPALLGLADDHATGSGVGAQVDEFLFPRPLSQSTAEDLWLLNESRLRTLRTRGVTSADLETLHIRAARAMEAAAEESQVALRKAAFEQSAALSRAVYTPLRGVMDDLVHAIVVLLLLAIPFAFSLERLVVGSTTIYGRIAGFTVLFLATFLMLYTMHPGFAVASTPIIIFLAFAIILLSGLVIFIIVRKFRTELKTLQGQKVGLHDVEVSAMATVLAAVSMGMSTMRRRPTRTTLTAVTVVMLTFTILSFASFTRSIGVRSVYTGPIGEETAGDAIIRRLDYTALNEHTVDLLRGRAGEGGLVAQRWWLVRLRETDTPFSLARPDTGQALYLDAIKGVSPEELDRWPQILAALSGESDQAKHEALEAGGVFLPSVVLDLLSLQVGDAVQLNGRRTFVAGTFDSASLQRLRNLDGQSILPVDFQDPAAAAAAGPAGATEDTDASDMVDKDFVYLSPDQIAITSAEVVKGYGGGLHALVIYAGHDVDAISRARQIAEIVQLPLWARGAEGAERMILTTLTEVSGGLALAVPVILGGLIIFGTLLGSITDREKEIYTFSALGLAPGHVGVLFFAEAAVYAIVGGMGGQLLAQVVALVTSYLHQMGWIDPPAINYSSTNSLFAIGIVMATVMISAIYPAFRASHSANPGLARAWKMPPPENDRLAMTFPFTVSAYDITGVVSYLAEHFERHDDAGLGSFAAQNVKIAREAGSGNLELSAELALAPFDLGVTQKFTLTAKPSEIPGVDEVAIAADRQSGAVGDWTRANRVFLRDLRRQFLLWRTLSSEMIETYRLQTLQVLGGNGNANPAQPGAGPTREEATT